MGARDASTGSQSLEFDERMANAVEQGVKPWLLSALETDIGRDAPPKPDHDLPLLHGVGAAEGGEASFPIEGSDMGGLSTRALRCEQEYGIAPKSCNPYGIEPAESRVVTVLPPGVPG